jgi:hypothetical protein
MEPLRFVVVGMSCLDLLFTYIIVKMAIKRRIMFQELNMILNFFWKKFGHDLGTLVADALIIPGVIIGAILAPTNVIWAFFGALMVVLCFHWSSIFTILDMKQCSRCKLWFQSGEYKRHQDQEIKDIISR